MQWAWRFGLLATMGLAMFACSGESSATDPMDAAGHDGAASGDSVAEGGQEGGATGSDAGGATDGGRQRDAGDGGDAGTSDPFDSVYVYVSAQDDDRIETYRMDRDTGELTFLRHESFDDAGPLAVNGAYTRLYGTGGGRIHAFELDSANGDLTPLGERRDGYSTYISVDASDSYVFTCSFSTGELSVHALNADGSVSKDAADSEDLGTDARAHAILPDPDNRWVFVPARDLNQVRQFALDADTGELTPNDPAFVASGDEGPRHIDFHPDSDYAYVTNEQGMSLTAYELDPSRGTLSEIDTEPSRAGSDHEDMSTSDVHVHPSGQFVYVGNRDGTTAGRDSIAVFAIDGATGALDRIQTEATVHRPREFDLDPTGAFLYAAGQDTGELAAYRIDETTGELTRFATYDVGRKPMWVLAVGVAE